MKINAEKLQKAFVITKTGLENQDLPKFLKRRWLRAAEKAKTRLLEQPFFAWQPNELTVVSVPERNGDEINCRFYRVSKSECRRLDKPGFCQAFFEGFPCWHRASLLLLEIYFDEKSEFQTDENQNRSFTAKVVNQS